MAIQDKFNKPDIIYKITQDIDLSGGTLTIPSGCTLDFQGGTISNGTIIGNKTLISGNLNNILHNVRLTGLYNNDFCDLAWWGCIKYTENEEFDNSNKITQIFNSSINKIIVSDVYGISRPIETPKHILIDGTNDSTGWKEKGFKANSNFSSITITLPRDGKEYNVKGMFYHSYDQHPTFNNITIDANYKAHYCIEHVAGYSNVEINKITLYNAIIAGVLQYGCEKMIWEQLYTYGCRIGAYISTSRIIEDNVFEQGETVSSANLITLYDCTFVLGNYGLICKGGSNYKLDNCKTSYNSLYGLILSGSRFEINNLYSERDGVANFYINNNGIKTYADVNGNETTDTNNLKGYGKVHPFLLNNDIDGILSKNGGYLETNPYLRAPIVIQNSFVELNSTFMSFVPRSYTIENVPTADLKLPTERNAAGVDSFIIINGNSNIIINNFSPYAHSSNYGSNSYPYKGIMSVSTDYNQPKDKIIINGFQDFKYWVDTVNYTAQDVEHYLVDDNIKNRPNIAYYPNSNNRSIYKRANYNYNIENTKYGTSILTPLKYNSFKFLYNNIPLYKRDTNRNNYSIWNITKEDMLSLFKDNEQIKYRLIVYLPSKNITNITISFEFKNSSNQTLERFSSTALGNHELNKGFYDIIGITSTTIKESLKKEWTNTHISVGVNNENVILPYVSPLSFYDIGDNNMVFPPFKSYVIDSGNNDLLPFEPYVGQKYFNISINKPIWWNGTKWVGENTVVNAGTF